MPHDMSPLESSLPEFDPELDDQPSHEKEESPILTAMRKAGSALVKKVKRIAPRVVLSAVAVAGAMLAAPQTARAQGWAGCYLGAWTHFFYCYGDGAPSGPTLGPPGQRPGAFTGGDPVDIATGNVFLHATDYTTAGPNQLQFIRYYNSMTENAAVNTLSYAFGNIDNGSGSPVYTVRAASSMNMTSGAPVPTHWRTNYDRYLQFTYSGSTLTQVIAERPDGQQITFTPSGSTWVPPTDQDYRLTQSGTTWTLTDHNDTKETYTNSGSGWAQLNTITARNGYQQTLSYGVTTTTPVAIPFAVYIPGSPPTVTAYYPNMLQSVTDSYGRSLNFTYNSNKLLSSVSTPDSLVVSYGYTYYGNVGAYTNDAGYLLTKVSYNTSPVTSQTYAYDVTSRFSQFPYTLLSVTDENGNTAASWQYDGGGEATYSQQGGIANATSFNYGSDSTIVSNANGVNDTYNYSILQGVQKMTSISRAATSNTAAATQYFTYDSNGFLKTATDWNGNQTNYTGNAHGDPTSITEAYGTGVARTTTITYNTTFPHLPATITTTGVTRSFTYDSSGNPLTMTDTDTTTNSVPYSTNGQTRETQWTWNSTGEMLSAQLPRTDATVKYTLTWSSGALTSITDPLSHVTNITAHTGGGYPTTISDPNSVTTTLGWDTRLNLNTVSVSTVGGARTTTYAHDPANNLASVTRPDGSQLSYTYDSANHVTNITDLPGNTVNITTLDLLENPTAWNIKDATNTTRYSRTATFDKLGRKLTDTDANANSTSFTYDPNGNLLTVTDALSNVTTYTYDALNRLSTRVDPSPGGTTTFTYDAHNRLTGVQDANGHSTSYTRDGFGDVTQQVSPDTGTTVYHYDKDSNLTQLVRNGGQTANLTYDANDRNLTVSYPADSTLNISKTYDQTGHGKGIGRVTNITDPVGSLGYTYEEFGRVTNEVRVITGATTLTTSTTYDAAGNVSSLTYPSGTVVNYTRDSMGQVTGISATPPGASSATTVVSSMTHMPWGPEKKIIWGNGVIGVYTYDNVYNANGREDYTYAADVTNLSYTFDARNSMTNVTDTVMRANTQNLTYDNLDRLHTASATNTGGYGSYAWTWDKVNNVTSQTINGTTTNFTLNSGTNQLASFSNGTTTTTVDTTSNGNILDFKVAGTAVTSFTYNAANQMASGTGPLGASASYKYGFDGQRLEKSPPGTYPIVYQYNRAANELLSENNLHGSAADYIYADPGRNPRPIAQVDPNSGNVYAMHTERQGTVVAVTDASQNVVWTALYNPFGDNPVAGVSGTLTTQSLRLPGQTADAETGNTHNGFRNYSGRLTRYAESDPSGLAGGMNTFQYVLGNPFKYTDRLGLDPGGTCPNGSTSLVCNGNNPDFLNPDDGDSDPDPLGPLSQIPFRGGGGGPGGGPGANNPDCNLNPQACPSPGDGPGGGPGDSNPNDGNPGGGAPGTNGSTISGSLSFATGCLIASSPLCYMVSRVPDAGPAVTVLCVVLRTGFCAALSKTKEDQQHGSSPDAPQLLPPIALPPKPQR